MDCRHHAPTSIAPSSMVVTDCRAGSFAPPSEAACVFHLLYNAHKQVFSLSILDYGDVRAARSWTKLSRTHFSMSFRSTVCDDLRTRREEKRSTQFSARNRKNRANIGLLTKARPSCVADTSHKTLTQRADYSSMTAGNSLKMRATKQRTK
jgi:hypothetical protein